jgi:hypothetical protein
MLTKINVQKLISYMPELIPIENLKVVLYKLDKMEVEKEANGKEVDWEVLKKDIEAW